MSGRSSYGIALRFEADGSQVMTFGDRSAYVDLAHALRAAPVHMRMTGDPSEDQALLVQETDAEGLEISPSGNELRFIGALDVAATNFEKFGQRTDWDHLHIEHYPGLFYLRSSSWPLIAR